MKITKPLLSILLLGIALQSAQTSCMQQLSDLASKHPHITKAVIGATLAVAGCWAWNKIYRNSLYWNDWKSVDHSKLEDIKVEGKPLIDIFKEKENFIWGTATSSYQVEGAYEKDGIKASSQWDKFAREKRTLKGIDSAVIKQVEDPGIACDHWNRYKDDAALMKDIYANGSRLSISWEKVVLKKPELLEDGSMDPTYINEDALSHYDDVCRTLHENNIRPAITLYHYAEPEWFFDMDGFEKQENIPYFVAFCKVVTERLKKYNPLWFTFNAAEGHATQGWLKGMKPPAKMNEYTLTAQVLLNLLRAHVQVYKTIHKIDEKAQVGILKNIMQLDPDRIWHPLDNFAAFAGNKLVNDSIYNFFKTGDFYVNIPTKVNFKGEDPEMKELIKTGNHALDFVGLNYYCHNFVHNMKPSESVDEEREPRTNNPRYPIYAEGLYRAIKEISEKMAKPCGDLPIYVTENGVAANNDETGNKIRELHNRRYIAALAKGAKHFNVLGYFHWSFMDNYEWGSYGKNYGIFEVERNNDLKRTLKPGAQFLVNLMKLTAK